MVKALESLPSEDVSSLRSNILSETGPDEETTQEPDEETEPEPEEN
jgi:hypothetical protein